MEANRDNSTSPLQNGITTREVTLCNAKKIYKDPPLDVLQKCSEDLMQSLNGWQTYKNEEIKDLELKLRDCKDKLTQVENARDEAMKEVQLEKSKNEDLHKRNVESNQMRSDLIFINKDLSSKLRDCEKKQKQLENDRNELKKDVEIQKSKIVDLAKRSVDSDETIRGLKDSNHESERKTKDLKKQMQSLEKENRILKAEKLMAELDIESLKDENNYLLTEKERFVQKVSELEPYKIHYTKLINDVNTVNTALQNQISTNFNDGVSLPQITQTVLPSALMTSISKTTTTKCTSTGVPKQLTDYAITDTQHSVNTHRQEYNNFFTEENIVAHSNTEGDCIQSNIPHPETANANIKGKTRKRKRGEETLPETPNPLLGVTTRLMGLNQQFLNRDSHFSTEEYPRWHPCTNSSNEELNAAVTTPSTSADIITL